MHHDSASSRREPIGRGSSTQMRESGQATGGGVAIGYVQGEDERGSIFCSSVSFCPVDVRMTFLQGGAMWVASAADCQPGSCFSSL